MSRPFRHPETGIYWFRKRVPDALRPVVGKREHKESLRTRDPTEAKEVHARVAAEVEARWRQLAAGVQTLTQRQAEAIAGEIYHDLVAENQENPGWVEKRPAGLLALVLEQHGQRKGEVRIYPMGMDPEKSSAMLAKWHERREQEKARRVDDWLTAKGLLLTPEGRQMLGEAVDRAVLQAREHLHRMSKGDYRPDPDGNRFPEFNLSPADTPRKGTPDPKFSPIAIFNAYVAERQPSISTRKKWRPYMEQVQREVPDLRDLTREWVLGWKNRLLAKGFKHRHVKESYIAALSAICEWAVDNDRLKENPAARIKIRSPSESKTRPKGYTDAEARQILTAAQKMQPRNITPTYRAARRWVPWLCAYTGARVGEIAQLRKADVQEREGVWCLWVTPEAGTTKDSNARWVALHPCLIEQGFLAFVKAARSGPLFYNPDLRRRGKQQPDEDDENPHFRKVGDHLARWIRSDAVGITDRAIQPNHAWRHRFKTVSRRKEVLMDTGARDYMQGHAPATVGEDYGDWEPAALLHEISKLPVMDTSDEG